VSVSCHLPDCKKKKKIWHRHLRSSASSSPLGTLSHRGLNLIKFVCGAHQPDGRINLTASAFDRLGQYTNRPGCRAYCFTELAIFFPSGGRNHHQYSLRLARERWPGWVSTKPRPKSVHVFLGLLYCFIVQLYVSCLPVLRDILYTPMAWYSLFVLKVPLNTKQPTNRLIDWLFGSHKYRDWSVML